MDKKGHFCFRMKFANNEVVGSDVRIFQAIGVNGGSLAIIKSVIENNVAARDGGILAGNGLMVPVNSTVSQNQAGCDQAPTGEPSKG